MSSVDVSSESAAGSPPVKAGQVKLEVLVLPVSDVDRAKRFYPRVSGPAPAYADYGSFAAFSDPDGNGWLLQGDHDTASGPLKGEADGHDIRVGERSRGRAQAGSRGTRQA